jgi:hypothetical protein
MRLLVATALLALTGCAAEPATSVIIARHRAASCLPMTPPLQMSGKTPIREWHETVALRDGSEVTLDGADLLPRRIVTATYRPDGHQAIAADAGDYIYPFDLRFDRATDRLYVATGGLAGGLFTRYYLFEYDLRARKLITKRRVNERDLPAMCPDPRVR